MQPSYGQRGPNDASLRTKEGLARRDAGPTPVHQPYLRNAAV